MDYKFTIFTPVYNGANFFHRVFKSLRNSTYTKFEWIIINDGSLDDSDKVIRELISTVDWEITYVNWPENRGKHIAWNHAVSIGKGDLWLPIDCDDAFIPEALTFYNAMWNKYKDNSLYGIDTLCFDSETKKIIGNEYPRDAFVSNFLTMKYNLHITGEKWGCVRMDLIKKTLFPELPGHFFTGAYLWIMLGQAYNVICFNVPLREYYVEATSICHRQVWEIDRFRMFNYYYRWLFRHFFGFIFREDPIEIIRLIREYVSNSVKIEIMRFLHAKEILRY